MRARGFSYSYCVANPVSEGGVKINTYCVANKNVSKGIKYCVANPVSERLAPI